MPIPNNNIETDLSPADRRLSRRLNQKAPPRLSQPSEPSDSIPAADQRLGKRLSNILPPPEKKPSPPPAAGKKRASPTPDKKGEPAKKTDQWIEGIPQVSEAETAIKPNPEMPPPWSAEDIDITDIKNHNRVKFARPPGAWVDTLKKQDIGTFERLNQPYSTPKEDPSSFPIQPGGKEARGFIDQLEREWLTKKAFWKVPLLGGVFHYAHLSDVASAANRLTSFSDEDYDKYGLKIKKTIEEDYPDAGFTSRRKDTQKTSIVGEDLERKLTREGGARMREADLQAVKNFIKFATEERETPMTFGGKVAAGLSIMPTWIAEFIITGGLHQIAEKSIRKAGIKWLHRHIRNRIMKTVGKEALRLGGWIGGTAARMPLMSPRVLEEYEMERMPVPVRGDIGEEIWERERKVPGALGDYEFNKNRLFRKASTVTQGKKARTGEALTEAEQIMWIRPGSDRLMIFGKKESPFKSMAKAFGRVYVETLSESGGPGLRRIGKIAGKKLGLTGKVLPKMRKFWGDLPINKGKAAKLLDKEFRKKISSVTGFDGLIEEYGEERLATIFHAVLDTEDFGAGKDATMWERFVAGGQSDLKNSGVEALVLLIPSATRRVAATGARKFTEHKIKKRIEKALIPIKRRAMIRVIDDVIKMPEKVRTDIHLPKGIDAKFDIEVRRTKPVLPEGLEAEAEVQQLMEDPIFRRSLNRSIMEANPAIGAKALIRNIKKLKGFPIDHAYLSNKELADEIEPEVGRKTVTHPDIEGKVIFTDGPLSARTLARHNLIPVTTQAEADLSVRMSKIIWGDDSPIIMADKDGSRGIVIFPSSSEPGKWQLSNFDQKGFSGHTIHDTRDEALNRAVKDGYKPVNHNVLKEFMAEPEWREGEMAEKAMKLYYTLEDPQRSEFDNLWREKGAEEALRVFQERDTGAVEPVERTSPAEGGVTEDSIKKQLERTGVAKSDNTTVKIVAHPSGDGFGVERTVDGKRELPVKKFGTIEEARIEAMAKLDKKPDEGDVKEIVKTTPETESATITAPFDTIGNDGFKIETRDGSQILGRVRNQDFPGEKADPNTGEISIVDVKDKRKGVGTSLVEDALSLMRENGTDKVVMTVPSKEVGKDFVQSLIDRRIISKPIETSESGTSLHKILTKPVEPKKDRKPQRRGFPGYKPNDITFTINAIVANGRMVPRSKLKHPKHAGEYDGAPPMTGPGGLKGFARFIFGGRPGISLAAGEMAQVLYDQKVLPEPSPDLMWERVIREMEAYRKNREFEAEEKIAAKEFDKWVESGSEVINLLELRKGDRFLINGEEFEVTEETDRALRVQDGMDFWVPFEPEGDENMIRIDRNSLEIGDLERPTTGLQPDPDTPFFEQEQQLFDGFEGDRADLVEQINRRAKIIQEQTNDTPVQARRKAMKELAERQKQLKSDSPRWREIQGSLEISRDGELPLFGNMTVEGSTGDKPSQKPVDFKPIVKPKKRKAESGSRKVFIKAKKGINQVRPRGDNRTEANLSRRGANGKPYPANLAAKADLNSYEGPVTVHVAAQTFVASYWPDNERHWTIGIDENGVARWVQTATSDSPYAVDYILKKGRRLDTGERDKIDAYDKQIKRWASLVVRDNLKKLLLIHDHPGGDFTASEKDRDNMLRISRDLKKVLGEKGKDLEIIFQTTDGKFSVYRADNGNVTGQEGIDFMEEPNRPDDVMWPVNNSLRAFMEIVGELRSKPGVYVIALDSRHQSLGTFFFNQKVVDNGNLEAAVEQLAKSIPKANYMILGGIDLDLSDIQKRTFAAPIIEVISLNKHLKRYKSALSRNMLPKKDLVKGVKRGRQMFLERSISPQTFDQKEAERIAQTPISMMRDHDADFEPIEATDEQWDVFDYVVTHDSIKAIINKRRGWWGASQGYLPAQTRAEEALIDMIKKHDITLDNKNEALLWMSKTMVNQFNKAWRDHKAKMPDAEKGEVMPPPTQRSAETATYEADVSRHNFISRYAESIVDEVDRIPPRDLTPDDTARKFTARAFGVIWPMMDTPDGLNLDNPADRQTIEEIVARITGRTAKQAESLYKAIESLSKQRVISNKDYLDLIHKIAKASGFLNTKNITMTRVNKARNEIFSGIIDRAYKTKNVRDILDLQDYVKYSPTSNADLGYYEKVIPSIIELPELVQFAKELTDGKYPKTMKNLRGAIGRFVHNDATGESSILIQKSLGKDPVVLAKVLAHEIGHLVDWLPDHTVKRGNILGHLAALKNYRKTLLEEYPGAPEGILTKEDRRRLRYQAEKMAKKGGEIISDITADDIKQVWNDTTGEIRKTEPGLYNYIAELSTEQKKRLLKDALKGVVSDWFDFKKAYDRASQTNKDLYRELLKKEIQKRKLYEYETMMDELKKLTQIYKPFTESLVPKKYIETRYSSVELFADGFSVLVNAPQLLHDIAPTFEKAFLSYLERRPKVMEAYNNFLAITGDLEARFANRRQNVIEMFRKGNRIRIKKITHNDRTHSEKWRDWLGKYLKDKNSAVWTKEWQLRKMAKREGRKFDLDTESPRYWLEEVPYVYAEIKAMMHEMGVIKEEYEVAGVNEEDIGNYYFWRRTSTERKDLINPLGQGNTYSVEDMERWRQKMDPKKWEALVKTAERHWQLRKEFVFPRLREAEMYDEDFMKMIENNEVYATFNVLEYLEEKAGFGSEATGYIYKQTGTFKEIENPFISTIMKDMFLLRAAAINKAKHETMMWMNENFGDEIEKAVYDGTGQFKRPRNLDPKKFELVRYLHNGKMAGYYVPKSIAFAFNHTPSVARVVGKGLNLVMGRWLKGLFVSYNPGWAVMNLERDLRAWAIKMPGADMTLAIKYANLVKKDVWKHVFKGEMPDVVKRLYRNRGMIAGRGYTTQMMDFFESMESMQEALIEGGTKQWENMRMKTNKFLDRLSLLGEMSEKTMKVAAIRYLDDYFPNMSEQEKMHMVRDMGGSPDFYKGGAAKSVYNNFFLFSNVALQDLSSSRMSWSDPQKPAREKGVMFMDEVIDQDLKSSFWWQVLQYDVLPKLAMLGASMGLFGYRMKRLYDKMSEYDKRNFICIPLYMQNDGKVVYLRMPHAFQGQVVAGALWTIGRIVQGTVFGEPTPGGDIGALSKYMIGQVPYAGVNPIIELALQTKGVMEGVNQVDPWTGGRIIPKRIWEIGGAEFTRAYAKHIAKQVGFESVIYNFPPKYEGRKTKLEKILGLPIAGPFMNRFIKVSDYGESEMLRAGLKPIKKSRNVEAYNRDMIMVDYVEAGYPMDDKTLKKFYNSMKSNPKMLTHYESFDGKIVPRMTFGNFKRRLNDIKLLSQNNAILNAFVRAESNEERAWLIGKVRSINEKTKTAEISERDAILDGVAIKHQLEKAIKANPFE